MEVFKERKSIIRAMSRGMAEVRPARNLVRLMYLYVEFEIDDNEFENEFKKWTDFHIPMLKDIEWYYEYGDDCVYIYVRFDSPFTHESVNVDVAVWKYMEDE